MIISLVVLPGTGQRDVSLPAGSTLQTLASQEGLDSRQLVLNGESVPKSAWDNTALASGVEVAALAGSKGN